MRSVWIIILTAILTAVIVGAGTYYVLEQKARRNTDELQSQIDDLQKQISSKQNSSNDDSTNNAADTTVSSNTSSATKTPKQVVDEFWAGYIDVNTIMESYLNDTTLLTAELKNRLITDNNGVEGMNAVTCAQDTPSSFSSVLNSSSAIAASVTVTEAFSPVVKVSVGLTLSNNNWLISSITCPVTQ